MADHGRTTARTTNALENRLERGHIRTMRSQVIAMGRIGPYSNPHKLAIIDGRTAEAKLMREYREELYEHCGGNPSTVQKRLIERAAIIHLRLVLMDKHQLLNPMSERNSRYYLAWSNALSRLLLKLGLEGADERPATLADYTATRGENGDAVRPGGPGRPSGHRTARRPAEATKRPPQADLGR